MTKTILAWHFAGDNLRDGRPLPQNGEWLFHHGECIMCESGLHASKRIIDALLYAPGSTICRVAIRNIADRQDDKLVAHQRCILWRLEKADGLLRAFARQAALSVIHLWNSPTFVRRYLETGEENLRADTWAAAEAASHAAADAAAWAAAWAAAEVAAEAAAEVAADAASYAAARAAAWAAAWAASNAAAEAAEWAGAYDTLNSMLETMVREAAGNPEDKIP